ncbi:endonuclease/exonuclease/phosphatase family metal-dependent hydrolase [Lutibacter sp. Hel_I_33_5]|uniref:endonuclease/exonuclease/phosphatase family protein n=1 Tax=Lutibacter sp. Hel_I_33_5 TaxID=1566289 RepID=UPI00119D45C8|nr:endonuclease/exonuclease/phosphatase family protein [Lutibacter sp. Hel_I_33_5]TVZ56782.1 endonuclease/exonuclease/phosphatase family metal-dependent hydrolase [Lutibacter sp. Hel_I_33_5]
MKKVLKFIFRLLVLFIVAFVIFFFWASSSNLEESEYERLIVNQFESTVTNDSIYSVVTYNIGYLSGMTNNRAVDKPKELYDGNLNKVISEIKKENPDIIAFQEIDYNASRSYNVNQQNEIAKLGYNYVAEGVNFDEKYLPYPYWPPKYHFGKVISGQSILSKYALKDYKRIVLQRVADAPFYRDALYLERLAQITKVEIEGKKVVLINVHLEAFDKITRVKQFEEVMGLFNQYKDKYPTILLGDFNSEARDEDAIIQKLFVEEGVGNAAFNAKNPINTFDSKKPYKRIDYIFYTENSIEYVDGKVLTQFGEASDHLPVQMRFKLKYSTNK